MGLVKVRKRANIRNRYSQAPYLTQDGHRTFERTIQKVIPVKVTMSTFMPLKCQFLSAHLSSQSARMSFAAQDTNRKVTNNN